MNAITRRAHDILIAARARISDKTHWTTRAFARDTTGCVVSPTDNNAAKWCVRGAISAEARREPLAENIAVRALTESTWSTPTTINDREGHAATLKLLDRAIKRLEAET